MWSYTAKSHVTSAINLKLKQTNKLFSPYSPLVLSVVLAQIPPPQWLNGFPRNATEMSGTLGSALLSRGVSLVSRSFFLPHLTPCFLCTQTFQIDYTIPTAIADEMSYMLWVWTVDDFTVGIVQAWQNCSHTSLHTHTIIVFNSTRGQQSLWK